MPGPFEIATKSAIEEIMKPFLQESKYGFFLTPEGMEAIKEEIYQLFVTSRDLKSKGDAFLTQLVTGRPVYMPKHRPPAGAKKGR